MVLADSTIADRVSVLSDSIRLMDNVVPSPSDFITFGPFLNLTTLSFQADTAVYITTLMQYSEFPSLKQIDLNFKRLPLAHAERLF